MLRDHCIGQWIVPNAGQIVKKVEKQSRDKLYPLLRMGIGSWLESPRPGAPAEYFAPFWVFYIGIYGRPLRPHSYRLRPLPTCKTHFDVITSQTSSPFILLFVFPFLSCNLFFLDCLKKSVCSCVFLCVWLIVWVSLVDFLFCCLPEPWNSHCSYVVFESC